MVGGLSVGNRSKAGVGWTLVSVMTLLVLGVVFLVGCGDDPVETTTGIVAQQSDIILASTTSTQDSGLFDVLLPAFQAAFPQYTVQIIAVGSGEAMALGEQKDADVLLVHSPDAERDFVANGFGTERRDVMYNDFVVVGPESDPAGVAGTSDAAAAFAKISEAGARFLSRGDESGTHKKELTIWAAAGVEPGGDWYESVGQGMGDVLRIASEREGYTLSDRATFLNLQDGLDLVVLVEGDEALFNQYGVIPVADAANLQGALDFADWITSDGQIIIEEYGMEKYGQPLFTPNAG